MKKHSWLLLTYQLPSKPTNIRVRVWRKLQAIGSISLKNSIYVLPNNPDSQEDFEWLRKEIIQAQGEASILLADSLSRTEDKEIIKAFQKLRTKDFTLFIEIAERFEDRVKRTLDSGRIKADIFARLEKEWKAQRIQWERLQKIDFFGAPNHSNASARIVSIQKALERAKNFSLRESPPELLPMSLNELKGRTWVTRKSPRIDRIASAWLIRKYIDSKAKFKFISEPYKPVSRNEIRFDMYEGEFTHLGDWCTFETLIHRLGLKDEGLISLAEIIHDIDLKDEKFGRAEAPGVGVVISGLCDLLDDDFRRLKEGIAVFEALHTALNDKKRRK